MRDLNEVFGKSFSGTLLLAHPSLLDPNFKRTVVLLSAHSSEEGAMGVVVNRPLGATLGQLKEEYADGPLATVKVYYGGPVSPGQMILAGMANDVDEGTFRLYFGLSPDKAMELLDLHPTLEVRGFLGYAGWTEGQLEGEMKADAWVQTPLDGSVLEAEDPSDMWRDLIKRNRPDLGLLTEFPEDPSLN